MATPKYKTLDKSKKETGGEELRQEYWGVGGDKTILAFESNYCDFWSIPSFFLRRSLRNYRMAEASVTWWPSGPMAKWSGCWRCWPQPMLPDTCSGTRACAPSLPLRLEWGSSTTKEKGLSVPSRWYILQKKVQFMLPSYLVFLQLWNVNFSK